MPRERHQNGWVVLSGKQVKKWIGHWHPYRANGTRGHSKVVLGEKSKMARWEAKKSCAPTSPSKQRNSRGRTERRRFSGFGRIDFSQRGRGTPAQRQPSNAVSASTCYR